MVALARSESLFSEHEACHYGDIWQLGQHRLLCGDSANADDVARLFAGEQFALCFTSPPYAEQRTYNLSSFNWHKTMCGAFDQMIVHGKSDCHILINLGLTHRNRQVDMYWLEWLMHCAEMGWPLFGWYVWDKGSGLPGEWGGRLAPSHEFLFHFNRKLRCPHKWIKTTGRSGGKPGLKRHHSRCDEEWHSPQTHEQPFKIPDSVVRINRAVTTHKIESNHPAVFPVALPEFIMQTWSQSDDIVYEPFNGSGTSIIAAENLQRRCYAIDISVEYCNLAIQRWQEHTGQRAQRLESSL